MKSKFIILLSCTLLTSCVKSEPVPFYKAPISTAKQIIQSVSVPFVPKEQKYFMARLTFYTNDGKFGAKTSSGVRSKEGITVAASKKIPFGTRYTIPSIAPLFKNNGKFIVQDRGSAVNKRTASRGKYPVIDVYVSSKAKVNKFKKIKNNIVKVYYK